MALGGDPPTDPDAGSRRAGLRLELVELARAIGGFSIGVAAQPGGHPLSADLAADRDHLAAKLALADFAVTQFFFEAHEYTSLVADLADRGVDQAGAAGHHAGDQPQLGAPDGAMGAAVPGWMVERLEAADAQGGAEAVRHEGVACATELCEQLLACRGARVCTSTRSTGRARPARSTPPWASARTDGPADPGSTAAPGSD